MSMCALLIAGTTLRVLFLADKPFWFDECFSVAAARLSWNNFVHLLWWREANMSLYYLLLRGWLHFGHSEFFIRSLSVVLSAASIPAVYWLANLLFDRRVGLFAAGLLSVNAYHIRYAQEARSYALFVLLATLSSAFLVAMLRTPSSRNRFGYILASTLAVYAHFYALLLVVAHWLAVRGIKRPCPEDKIEFSAVAGLRKTWLWIGILVLPLLVFVGKLGAGPIKWIQRPGIRDVLEYYEHMSGNAGWLGLSLYLGACVWALASAGKHLSRAGAQDWENWRSRFLLLWILFPVVLTVALSIARPVFYARYLLFCLPAFVILAAAGLARLPNVWLRAAFLVAMMLLSVKGTLSYYRHDFDLDRDGIGAASAYVLRNTQPGDGILFHIPSARAAYEFYRLESSAPGPAILFPHHANQLDFRDFTGKPAANLLQSASACCTRIWVVLMYNGSPGDPDPTTTMIGDSLNRAFPQTENWEFPEVEVRLYSK